jgi:hypothetical protein
LGAVVFDGLLPLVFAPVGDGKPLMFARDEIKVQKPKDNEYNLIPFFFSIE